MLKKIFLFLLTALVIIQFIHPKPNKSKGDQPNYIGKTYPVPEDVRSILAKACNDCHSNNTKYPWYSNIQPVDWWMAGHIRNGKKGMNLDDYTSRPLRFQYHRMDDLMEQVKEGKMPLNSYLWIHKNAKLTPEEKKKLIDWAQTIRDSMEAKYPMDSLVKKKQ